MNYFTVKRYFLRAFLGIDFITKFLGDLRRERFEKEFLNKTNLMKTAKNRKRIFANQPEILVLANWLVKLKGFFQFFVEVKNLASLNSFRIEASKRHFPP